ncbi:MAG: winged helix DNA-binding protein [Myxococcaceae bacterium]|nr:winged helix DNA-binding protein [Myxococcaceae bacterium]
MSDGFALVDLDLAYLAQFVGLTVAERVQQALAKSGHPKLRYSHGFVVQHLVDAERSIGALAERMEVTQQAASKMVAELERLGYVERMPGADHRVRTVRLSSKGREAVERTRRIRARLDARIERALGARRHAQVKEALMEVLKLLGGAEAIHRRRVRAPR